MNYKIGTYHFTEASKKVKPKRHNKYYACKLTKRRKEINSRRAVALLLVSLLFGTTYAFAMTSNDLYINGAVVEDKTPNTASFVIPQVEGDQDLLSPPSIKVMPVMIETENEMQNWVLSEVKKAGLNADIAFKIIKCESNWQPEVYGVNTNGTTDFGLWQINSIHKKEISPKERLDYKKATMWAINKRLKDGNWSAWNSSSRCWNK